MNRQRVVIYEERRRVLEGEDLHEQVRGFLDDTIEGYVVAETSEGYAEDWDLDRLWTALKTLYPVGVTPDEVIDASGGGGQAGLTQEYLVSELQADAHAAYDAREETLTPDVMRELERRVVLSVLDRKWREHLYEMDYLQEGIGLRAMAQKDPLVEYQREGYILFNAMMESIKEESVGYLFNVEVQVEDPALSGDFGGEDSSAIELTPQAAPKLSPTAAEPEGASSNGATTNGATNGAATNGAATGAVAGSGSSTPSISAKGLGPQRPQRLEYTAPSVDGEAGVVQRAEDVDDVAELSPDASRAERRRAERAARKKK
jgi:preprotein translocase subunit SecA